MNTFGLKRPVYSFGLGPLMSVVGGLRELVRRVSRVTVSITRGSVLWR